MRKNQILSFLTALAMILNMAPLAALAEDGGLTLQSEPQTAGIVLPKYLKAGEFSADGTGYSVLVSYGDDALFPEGTQMTASFSSSASDAMAAYQTQIEEQIADSNEGIGAEIAGLFDISFLNGEEEAEPKTDVNVSITMDSLPSAQAIRVFRYDEEEQTPVRITELTVDGNTVSFTGSGSSVYAIASARDLHYWIYLEKGQKEYQLKDYFESRPALGSELLSTIMDASPYFFDSSSNYVWDYGAGTDGTKYWLSCLENIPAGDYIRVGFYDWDSYKWIQNTQGNTLWLYFIAPAKEIDESAYHDDMFWYELDESDPENVTAEITGIYDEYTGTTLEISGKTRDENAYPVATVPKNAFKGNNKITSVIFTNTEEIQVLGGAFQSMSKLETVAFTGSGLVSIGGGDWENPFGSCGALKSVTGTDDSTVTFTSMGIFQNCGNLQTVKLGNVLKINQNTFIDNNGLLTFEANNIDEIGCQGFNRCGNLQSFRVNGDAGTFASWAMDGCKPLTTVRIDGNVGTINGQAFGNASSMDSFIVLGDVGTIRTYGVNAGSLRVAVIKGKVTKLEGYAFNGSPFSQDNNLIYIGSVDRSGKIEASAFGWNSSWSAKGTAFFNCTTKEVEAVCGGDTPNVYLCFCSDQNAETDVYVRDGNSAYGYGSSQNDAWNTYNRAFYSMYNKTSDRSRFSNACAAAGVTDLGLEFYGKVSKDTSGFVLHVLPAKGSGTVSIPADLYGGMLDDYGLTSGVPATFDLLTGIVFENEATTIQIPAGAFRKFPNLASVTVLNTDAEVTIGKNAFAGTDVHTITAAQQTVTSEAGTVTFAKGANVPIGTALVMDESAGEYDSLVIAAAREAGLFTGYEDSQIRTAAYDLSLTAPDGTAVNTAATVTLRQKLNLYSGADTIAPKAFAFFHIEDGKAELVTREFTADSATGTMTYTFDTTGFSPYVAAYIPGASAASDGVFTYLAGTDGTATITGYDTGFSGNILSIPNTTVLNGETYTVAGIAEEALTNPPEAITSIVFNNEGSLLVGSGAMSGLRDLAEIRFGGAGSLTFSDGTAFADSGAGTVAVSMPNGLTAQTADGGTGAVFSGLNGGYTLEIDNTARIPDGAFTNDTHVTAVTVRSALENNGEFEAAWVNTSRGDFNTNAIGTSAFEGASNLQSFTVEGSTGNGIVIGNEAFLNCTSLTELNLADPIVGLGEQGLRNTGFTSLTLVTDEAELGKESLAYCSNLDSLTIRGGVNATGQYFLGGSGDSATKLRTLVFDGTCNPQLYNKDIRGERLSVLVFKNGGSRGITDNAIYMEGEKEAESLTVYVDGAFDDNPYISSDAFPAEQSIRLYMDLPISREEASQTNRLAKQANITDLAYSMDEAIDNIYINTDLEASTASCFNSYEEAEASTNGSSNPGKRFRQYFAEAGYHDSDLNLVDKDLTVTEFTLHVTGKTERIDDTFAGDPRLVGVSIELDSGRSIVIDDGAFKDCENLKELTFSSVYHTEIGKNAFENCTQLSEFSIRMKYNLTIHDEAFRNCSSLDTVSIYGMDYVTIEADAFAGDPVKKVSIQNSYKPVTIGENAFRNMESLSTVEIATLSATSGITIGPNAFADCGEIESVFLKKSTTPEIAAGAFRGDDIGILRLDGGSEKIQSGAFTGGKTLIDGGKTYTTSLTERIGNFETIILTQPQTIDASAQVFSGNADLKYIYLGKDSSTTGVGGEIFDGIPESAEAYIAHKMSDYSGTRSAESTMPVRTDGGALRFMDDIEGKYIDGTIKTGKGDGSYTNPFRSFEEAKASIVPGTTNSNGTVTSLYYEEIQEVLTEAFEGAGLSYTTSDLLFARTGEEANANLFYVKGTITVSQDTEWTGDDGNIITLVRDDGFTGALVQVTGAATLTLENVVLDGMGKEAKAPLIFSTSSKSTIVIHEGTELRNNDNTQMTYWIHNEYTGGGAIHTTGNLVMDGGVISGNKSYYGGGIHISGGTFDMTGGTITGNTAYLAQSGGNISYSNGGGVLVTQKAVMNLSGSGSVSNNRAVYGSGAGICLGAMYAVNDSNVGYLNMTGGSISGNTSEFEGGGLYIQMGSKAVISGGSLTGNRCLGGVASPNYGGGAVYVNGTHGIYNNFPDGELYLTNVLITGNSASTAGGAIAGCGTSTNRIYLTDGSAIYGNTAGDNADLNFDYTSYWAYYGYSPACMTASISPYMFNGTRYNWTDAETDELIADSDLAMIDDRTVHLRANPGEGAPTTGSVIISGNTSASRGGAIGTNGTVVIGKIEPQTIEMTPEAGKILLNGDMEEDETYTFSTYLETYSDELHIQYSSETVDYYVYETETLLGSTGTVAGAKDGTVTAITGLAPYTVDVSEKDLGKTFTVLVVEDTTSSGNMTADESTYLEFKFTVGFGPDGKLSALPSSAAKGVYERNEDGTPNFNVQTETYTWAGVTYTHRITTPISLEDAVFINTKLYTDYTADKQWVRYDGRNTPPEGARVVLELYADGEPTGMTVELDGTEDENGESAPWTAAWKNLAVYRSSGEAPASADDDGKIVYVVKEISVVNAEGFAADEETVEMDEAHHAVLINRETPPKETPTPTPVPETTERTVRKVWEDDGNQDGLRPESIQVTLTANGTAVERVTLNAANGWTATVGSLPVTQDGAAIVYAWSEQEVVSYTQDSAATEGTVTTFVNRIVRVPEVPPEEPQPNVPANVNNWKQGGLEELEEYNTALGGETIINHVGDCFD